LTNNFSAVCLNPIFAKTTRMATRKSSSNYWIRFLLWIGVLILLIVFYPQLLWMALPGIVTNFALALNIM